MLGMSITIPKTENLVYTISDYLEKKNPLTKTIQSESIMGQYSPLLSHSQIIS